MSRIIRFTGMTVFIAAMASVVLAWPANAAEQPKNCENYFENWDTPGVAYQNDIWNPGDIDGHQCVNGNSWQWDWPEPADGKNAVRSYPSAFLGQKPWGQKSSVDYLPARISSIDSLVIDYSIKTKATGMYNTAFDVWIASEIQTDDGSSITGELMIWLQHTPTFPPAGRLKGTVTIGGMDYDLFVRTKEERPDLQPYYGFIAKDYRPKGSFTSLHS